jgi:dUTP pyrophosphatase
VKVKFKKLSPDAVIPSYAKPGDAGLDMVAATDFILGDDGLLTYRTGLAVEIPPGFVGLIFPRSSISKTVLRLVNSVGVIDSGYRGEIMFKFWAKPAPGDLADKPENDSMRMKWYRTKLYKKGDRVGQLIIVPFPTIETEEAEELSDSDRGTGGFGSTGA